MHKDCDNSLAKIHGNLAIGKNRGSRHNTTALAMWEHLPNHRPMELRGHNLKATEFREIFPFISATSDQGPRGACVYPLLFLQRQLKRTCLVQIFSLTADRAGSTRMPSRATAQICFPCIWCSLFWLLLYFFHLGAQSQKILWNILGRFFCHFELPRSFIEFVKHS